MTPEKYKIYYQLNKDRLKKEHDLYNSTHKLEAKQWRTTNRDKVLRDGKVYTRTLRARFSHGKRIAKRLNRSWTITFEQYEILLSNPCFYCGGPLPETGSGLDRQDVTLGYDLVNVVPCCWPCNRRKGGLETAGFNYPRSVELLREALTLEKV